MKISLFSKSIPIGNFSSSAHIATNSALDDLLDNLESLAIVSKDIAPFQSGRVYFQATWWTAVCPQNVQISVGKTVRVIGRRNITLLVELIPNQ
ncbi:NfeD family protein [Leptolyngbya sp. FACHB-541]|uniref:NfeD family protein n=1 Tax=Leptolyngbya sp. FACHB-541 TaxID=2692810 RepID=UPI001683214F|nr:NfeD family protein [Leptolyngbya sp. FACHB-541]MBD1997684.1 NfeD family protein [Leptolyngbya sp. FACHB-541]